MRDTIKLANRESAKAICTLSFDRSRSRMREASRLIEASYRGMVARAESEFGFSGSRSTPSVSRCKAAVIFLFIRVTNVNRWRRRRHWILGSAVSAARALSVRHFAFAPRNRHLLCCSRASPRLASAGSNCSLTLRSAAANRASRRSTAHHVENSTNEQPAQRIHCCCCLKSS